VIFGDATSHDPSNGHSLADTIAALQAASVRVVAVNVGALDADGQATALTNATGGVLLNNVPPTRCRTPSWPASRRSRSR